MSYIQSIAGPDEMFIRGSGAWLEDRAGHRFLDGRSGIANMVLGYSRRDIADAMHEQACELPFVCTLRYDRPAAVTVSYAEALVAIAPAELTAVRFTHTGSSAVESAVLMARLYQRNRGNRRKLLTVGLLGSYHGSTLTTMAAGGQPSLHQLFGPMPEGFTHLPEPAAGDAGAEDTLRRLTELDPRTIAALLVEPVKALDGTALPAEWLRQVRQFCTEHDIVLIYDEVFSGVGRMGPMFATEISGVVPDIMCLSKALTAGYAPLGAVLASDKVYDAFNLRGRFYFAHGSSTDAHPIACAAGLATLRAFESENVLPAGTRTGDQIRAQLASRLDGHPWVAEIRALGAYVAIAPAQADHVTARMAMLRHIQAQCERRGVLIDYTPEILMLVPPLTLPADDASLLASTVADVITDFRPEDVDPSALRPPSLSGRR
jgi:adenosylmethionine-8-amino-7-oxononanoate aminotransferase